jgi:N6-L-threonylcarbamoyladenine synthase
MINSKNFNFSFSGLKTAVLYLVKKNEKLLKNQDFINEISHEFQQAVVDVLVSKTIAAAKKYNPKTIMLAGGVSANIELRRQLGEAAKKNIPNAKYKIPDTNYSMDNATMIAAAASFRAQKTKNKKILFDNWKTIMADANMELK